jgi:hypothetical protein
MSVLDGTATVGTDGSWTVSMTLGADGAQSLTASDTDAAGNPGISAAVSYTLNTKPPAITVTLAHDTGSSGADKITSDPTLGGLDSAAGLGANATTTIGNGATALSTTVADSTGTWLLKPSGLSDGNYNLSASETDPAGNTGIVTVAFTLDVTSPVVSMALAHDTGSVDNKVTNGPTLTGQADANARSPWPKAPLCSEPRRPTAPDSGPWRLQAWHPEAMLSGRAGQTSRATPAQSHSPSL